METIGSLVVGIADAEGDDPLLAPALELARRMGAALHLVHAFDPPELPWTLHLWGGELETDYLRPHVRAVRARLEARAAAIDPAVRVRVHVVHGAPETAIRNVAAEAGAALVLVGPTRRLGVAWRLLGTTAQRVVRTVDVPVLVLRTQRPLALRRVLLTADLSPLSGQVHRAALNLLPALGTGEVGAYRSLLVLGHSAEACQSPGEPAAADRGAAELRRFVAEHTPPAAHPDPVVRTGDPAREILSEAVRWGADLVVLGTHGRSGAPRWLLGSVAEAVVRAATTHLLVVPEAAAPLPAPPAALAVAP